MPQMIVIGNRAIDVNRVVMVRVDSPKRILVSLDGLPEPVSFEGGEAEKARKYLSEKGLSVPPLG